jgi:hypothetical protein
MAKKVATTKKNIWIVTSDGKLIAQQQSAFNATTATMRDQAAILGASCVLHMLEHENATAMTRFARDAIERGIVRADAIVKWAVGLGIFRVAKEVVKNAATGAEEKIDVFKKNTEGFAKAKAEYEKDKDTYAKALVEKPFYLVVKAPNPFAGVNFLALAYALIDQVERIKEDEDKLNHENTDLRAYDDVKAVITKFARPEKKTKKKAAPAPVTAADANEMVAH